MSPSAIIDSTMADSRIVTVPARGGRPTSAQYASAVIALAVAMERCPGPALPPLGQDREYEAWASEYAKHAVGACCPVLLCAY